MREYSTPLTVEIQQTGNLTDDIVENGIHYPQVVSFSRKTASGWTDVTAAEFLDTGASDRERPDRRGPQRG